MIITFRDDTDLVNGEIALKERLTMYEAALDRIRAQSSQIERAENRLTNMLFVDSLTNLSNARALADDTKNIATLAGQYLVVFGVDGMRAFNQAYGQVEGDNALKSIGQLLQASAHDTDRCYRIKGDEFAVITTDVDRLTESFQLNLRETKWCAAAVSVSCGSSQFADDRTFRDVLGDAQTHRKAKRAAKVTIQKAA